MKKSATINIAFFVMIVIIASCIPFLNGIGCNFVYSIKSGDIDDIYGRCESGIISATILNESNRNVTHIQGRFGIIGDRFFIINTDITSEIYQNDKSVIIKHSRNIRSVYSGITISNPLKGDAYILTGIPYPVMRTLNIEGRLSLSSSFK
ncbi:TPA: hypothetical protein OUF36_004752 [Enterobacter hormaechei]|nr:hypothetical protein [Enterobacter hormaechei]